MIPATLLYARAAQAELQIPPNSNCLEVFQYFSRWIPVLRAKRGSIKTLIVDSSAYGIWNTGADTRWAGYRANLPSYLAFLQAHEADLHNCYKVNFDVIGVDDSAALSFRNYNTLCKAGISNVLPVYHAEEELADLQRYIDAGAQYIGFGVQGLTQGEPYKKICATLDYLYTHHPNIRVHLFGSILGSLLMRYPIYSCDSATWVLAARFGGFFCGLDKRTMTIQRMSLDEVRKHPTIQNIRFLIAAGGDRSLLSKRGGMSRETRVKIMGHNLSYYLALQEALTEHWAARGVVYDES